jgi:hypothetical protein
MLVICSVHKNSNVKSLDPCLVMFQKPSHPTALKMRSSSTSIPIACSRTGSYIAMCTNLRVFSFLKASFSVLVLRWICDSSYRKLLADGDNGGTWATGDGALTFVSKPTHEDVLLVERDEDERVNCASSCKN